MKPQKETIIKFQPMLVGKNEDAIAKEIDKWDYTIGQLNELVEEWERIFNAKPHLDRLEEILEVDAVSLLHIFRIHWIESKPKLNELAKGNHIKLKKLIEITDFPDFEKLMEYSVSLKNYIKNDSDNLILLLPQLFENGKFIFPERLKTKIREKHTFYTSNINENIALAIVTNFCSSVNMINNLGGNLIDRDFPLMIQQLVETRKSSKKYKELPGCGYGQKDYYIPNLQPSCYMFKRDSNSLMNLLNRFSAEKNNILAQQLL